MRKDFPPKAPAPTLWQKIESRLISIPGTNTISATKFPTSSIPPVAAPQEKTASASAPAAAQPPKIPTVTTATQSSRDISTVAQPVKLNPLTSAPPPVKVPPKAEPTGQIAAKSGEKADPTPATTTTDKPIQTAPPVVKLPPGLPPQSSVTAPPAQIAPASDKKPGHQPDAPKVPAPAAPTAAKDSAPAKDTSAAKTAPADTKAPVAKDESKKDASSSSATASTDEKTKSAPTDDKKAFKPENQKLDEILKNKEAAKPAKKSTPGTPQPINWWAVKTFVAWGFTVIFFAGFYWIYTKYNGQVEDMKRLRTEQLEAQSKVRSMEEQLQAARTLATSAQELERTFQERFQQFQQTIDRLENEKASLMDDIKARDARIEFLEGNLGRVVFMASTSSSAAAFARCIWDDTAGTGVIYARNLPKLSEGKTWQVWAVIDDQDVPIGFLNPNLEGSGSGALKLDGRKGIPEEFFVTDEPIGGSSGPTGDTIISGS